MVGYRFTSAVSHTSQHRYLALDASLGLLPTAANVKAGDYYTVTMSGIISGIVLNTGDQLLASIDNAASMNDYVKIEGNRGILDFDASLGVLPTGAGIIAGQQWRVTTPGQVTDIGFIQTPNILTALIDAPASGADFVLMREALRSNVFAAPDSTLTIEDLGAAYAVDLGAPITTMPSTLTATEAGYYIEFFDSAGTCSVANKDVIFPQGINGSGVPDTYRFDTNFAGAKFEWTGSTWRIVYQINT